MLIFIYEVGADLAYILDVPERGHMQPACTGPRSHACLIKRSIAMTLTAHLNSTYACALTGNLDIWEFRGSTRFWHPKRELIQDLV